MPSGTVDTHRSGTLTDSILRGGVGNALPEGAQVLRKALVSASQPNATDTDTAETSGAGSEGTEAALEPPSDVPPKERKIRELLTTTDLVRLRYTAPPIRLGTVTLESEGVVSIEHDELGAAQELERRLRRRWGRADGESESEEAHHDTSQSDKAPSDHASIPHSIDLLGYGAHYLSKISLAAHALVHGELFEDPEVARAALEAETLAARS